jgi:hypothetical protein
MEREQSPCQGQILASSSFFTANFTPGFQRLYPIDSGHLSTLALRRRHHGLSQDLRIHRSGFIHEPLRVIKVRDWLQYQRAQPGFSIKSFVSLNNRYDPRDNYTYA